jgi:FAD synthetase
MFGVVERIRPDIIALGYDQDFDERMIEETLRERGMDVKVVRLSKHGEDLNGTRKIIGKIIEWYSKNIEGLGGMMKTIGIVDTTFARADMGAAAIDS